MRRGAVSALPHGHCLNGNWQWIVAANPWRCGPVRWPTLNKSQSNVVRKMMINDPAMYRLAPASPSPHRRLNTILRSARWWLAFFFFFSLPLLLFLLLLLLLLLLLFPSLFFPFRRRVRSDGARKISWNETHTEWEERKRFRNDLPPSLHCNSRQLFRSLIFFPPQFFLFLAFFPFSPKVTHQRDSRDARGFFALPHGISAATSVDATTMIAEIPDTSQLNAWKSIEPHQIHSSL